MNSKTAVQKQSNKSSLQNNKFKQNSVPVRTPARKSDPLEIIQRIHKNPDSLTRDDAMLLQSTIGNKALTKLLKDSNKNKNKDLQKKEARDDKTKDNTTKDNTSEVTNNNIVKEEKKPKEAENSQINDVHKDIEQKKGTPQDKTHHRQDNGKQEIKNEEKKPKELQKNTNTNIHQDKAAKQHNKVENNEKTEKAPKANIKNQILATAKSNERLDTNQTIEQKPNSKSENDSPKPKKMKEKVSKEKEISKKVNTKEQEAPVPIKNKAVIDEPQKEKKTAKNNQASKGAAEANVQVAATTEVKTQDLGMTGVPKRAPAKSTLKIKGDDPGNVMEQLNTAQPSDIMSAFPQVLAVSGGALENQKQKTQGMIPEIPTPTGIASGISEGKAKSTVKPVNHAAPDSFASEKSGGKAYEGNAPEISSGSGEEDPDEIMREARQASKNPPSISMDGEADPSQINGFKAEATKGMQAAQQAEYSQMNNDFGENSICPKPDNTILKSDKNLKEVTAPSIGFEPPLIVTENVVAELNKSNIAPMLKAQLDSRKNEYQKGKLKFDDDAVAAKTDTNTQIEQMKSEAKDKQLNEQAGAKAEVEGLRGEWKSEIQGAVSEYDQQANSASEDKKREIGEIKSEKEGEVNKTMAEAERDAQKEHKEAKAKAEEKQGEEKKEKKNWLEKAWDWTKEKAQQVVDGIKKAVNFIFEGLRKAVKVIFDKAKQFAISLIEAGRKLIVNVIKGLGEVLKGLVKTVFAKFPQIANKICGKIDAAVNKAVKAVNTIADGLKKGVSKALDFLANTLDTILSKVQSLYNSILNGIGKFLQGGFKEIFGTILEGLQIAAEVAAAFATGGGSILIQIGIWLGTTLPNLFKTVSSVISFVNDLRSMKLSDVKQFLSPGKIGDFLVRGLFGELQGLPEGEKEDKEKEPAGGRESKGLLKVLSIVSGVFKKIKAVYGKVAGGINKVLSVINITSKPWFNPFSAIYAGAVKAMEVVQNPAQALSEGAGNLKAAVGGFFTNIKTKLSEAAGGIKEKLMLVGKPAELMKVLANKAVDMVLNFIITHPPSALIKAAFKAIEAASGSSIVDLIRQHIPFADKLINKIAESSPVQNLLQPLQPPVNAIGSMVDEVTDNAINMVDESEQKALNVVGSGEKILSGLAGVSGGKASGGKKESGGGGGDFLGTVKSGVHTRLMAIGSRNLLSGGLNLAKKGAKAGVDKVKAGAKAGADKVKGMILGHKIKFNLTHESHQLWIEKKGSRKVVIMASEEGPLDQKMEELGVDTKTKHNIESNIEKIENHNNNEQSDQKSLGDIKSNIENNSSKVNKVSEKGKESGKTQREMAKEVPNMTYEQVIKALEERYKEFIKSKRDNNSYIVSQDGLLDKELNTSSYKDMPRSVNDNLTPHHMPAGNSIGIDGIKYKDGTAFNMREDTHKLTFTYGMGNSDSRAYDYALYNRLSYEDRLNFDQRNVKDAYLLQRPKVNQDELDIKLNENYLLALKNYNNHNKGGNANE